MRDARKYEPCDLVVRTYSGLDFSFQSDKLPALSGLAQRMARVKACRYLAGIWEHDLPCHLLWYVGKANIVHKKLEATQEDWCLGIRSTTYRAPTWSWASLGGNIYFNTRHAYPQVWDLTYQPVESIPEFMAEIMDVAYLLSGADPFGCCAASRITISGPLVTAKLSVLDEKVEGTLCGRLERRDFSMIFCPDTNISGRRSSEFLPSETSIYFLEILRTEWVSLEIVLKQESKAGL